MLLFNSVAFQVLSLASAHQQLAGFGCGFRKACIVGCAFFPAASAAIAAGVSCAAGVVAVATRSEAALAVTL